MYHLLVRLMLLAALAEIGMSLFEFENCHSRACIPRVESGSRDILKIDWKPISVWPEEAKRFQSKHSSRR